MENDGMFERWVDRAERSLTKALAKKGKLGLPPLLDARRLEYGIPDGAFKLQAAFDRILVYQIPINRKNTFGDTSIIKPETSERREAEEAPRGILVSAGMKAMDNLRSNGIDLGHIVSFIRLSPWRMYVDCVEGLSFHIMILRDGDLLGSEDLRAALVQGKCKIEVREYKDEEGVLRRCHMFKDSNGDLWDPEIPWIPEDY